MFENWRQDNRVPLALMAVMGLFALIYIYDLWIDLTLSSPLPLPAQTIHVQPLTPINAWHLFGVYDDNLADLPPTQLQLTLEGVMLSVADSGQSFAIVSSPGQPAKAYKVGDTLPGDALLKKIMKDQIVLSYQGVLQSLKLPYDQLLLDSQ